MSSLVIADDVYAQLDQRTLELLRRRQQASSRIKGRGWLIRRALVCADVAGLVIAFIVAEVLFPVQMNRAGSLSVVAEVVVFAACLPAWVVAAKLYGLYSKDEEHADHSTADDFARVFHLMTVGAWLLWAASLTTDWFNPQFQKIFVFWVLSVIGVPLIRAAARAFCRRQIFYLQNTVIVGAGVVGQTVARKLLKHPEYGINVVGFVDDDPLEPIPGLEHVTVLGDPESLPQIVGLLDVERVIYAFSREDGEASVRLIRTLNELGVQVDIIPRFFDVVGPGVELHTVEGLPMWALSAARLPRSSRLLKRALDVLGSSVSLLLLGPVFLGIACAIKLDTRGPVFFRQMRVGVGNRPFRIWKFRTMSADAEARKIEFAHLNKHLAPGGDPRMFKIEDDPRATRAGRFLRRWSLDELPQLFNVLRGEMSLVGPRPLILAEDRFVDSWGRRRLDLKPGITGSWQVLGRDEIGFEEMLRLDYVYVTNWSVGRDLQLMVRTLPTIWRAPSRG